VVYLQLPKNALLLLNFIYFTIIHVVSFIVVINLLYSQTFKNNHYYFALDFKNNLQVHLSEGNMRKLNH
jgi:hypothetical protein